MGTDIHLQVQGRRDGIWEFVNRKPFPSWGSRHFSWGAVPTGRDYDLFAFLANVRNGFGFAGCYRHEPISPPFADRGLPEDYVNPEEPTYTRETFTGGDFWIGDHSFTWATLAELRDAPWDMEFTSGGIVGPEDFGLWQETGMPSSWSGDVSGPDIVVHNDTEEYAKMIVEGRIRKNGSGYIRALDLCRITWKWKPVEGCTFRKWIDGETMKAIEAEYGGAENVRVIMGFDS